VRRNGESWNRMVSAVIRRNRPAIWPPAWGVELLGRSSKGLQAARGQPSMRVTRHRYGPPLPYLRRETRRRSHSRFAVAPATGSRRTAKGKRFHLRDMFPEPFAVAGTAKCSGLQPADHCNQVLRPALRAPASQGLGVPPEGFHRGSLPLRRPKGLRAPAWKPTMRASPSLLA
jgi:hypothetical protein